MEASCRAWDRCSPQHSSSSNFIWVLHIKIINNRLMDIMRMHWTSFKWVINWIIIFKCENKNLFYRNGTMRIMWSTKIKKNVLVLSLYLSIIWSKKKHLFSPAGFGGSMWCDLNKCRNGNFSDEFCLKLFVNIESG